MNRRHQEIKSLVESTLLQEFDMTAFKYGMRHGVASPEPSLDDFELGIFKLQKQRNAGKVDPDIADRILARRRAELGKMRAAAASPVSRVAGAAVGGAKEWITKRILGGIASKTETGVKLATTGGMTDVNKAMASSDLGVAKDERCFAKPN